MANEVKRHPSAVRRPPMTAVSLVDFRRHIPMVSGDSVSETHREVAPNQPEKRTSVFRRIRNLNKLSAENSRGNW